MNSSVISSETETSRDHERRPITVFYNGDDHPVKIAPGVYTTEQLMKIFGVESGYELNVIEHHKARPLKPGESIKLKEGMHFFSQVPCGGTS